ncbi:hypothetical protein ABEF93_003323 [Exophiala dermatitidis]
MPQPDEMAVRSPPEYTTTIDRYYIDTRQLVLSTLDTKSTQSLPLLATLQYPDQEAVTRFIRPSDRYMSLASALLKYTFIHRRAKIPWSKVQVSRTPAPHRRPYWVPLEEYELPEETCSKIGGLEFNVSHQAGLVAIIGCSTPRAQLPTPHTHSDSSTINKALDQLDLTGHRTPILAADEIRLGVDIACTNEDRRTPQIMTTQAQFDEWVDIFAEMFSERERWTMRHAPIHIPVVEREEGDYWDSDTDTTSSSDTAPNGNSYGTGAAEPGSSREAKLIHLKLRRFYAYWALKEAYIKMVGEGLLASWLQKLEFMNVVAPPSPTGMPRRSWNQTSTPARTLSRSPNPTSSDSKGVSKHQSTVNNDHKPDVHLSSNTLSREDEVGKWTPPEKAERGVKTLLYGREVEDVDIELVAYDEDFLLATALRGVKEQQPNISTDNRSQWKRWVRLDIEQDIRPCAEGKCHCLDEVTRPQV